jgi:hypothetical protein
MAEMKIAGGARGEARDGHAAKAMAPTWALVKPGIVVMSPALA